MRRHYRRTSIWFELFSVIVAIVVASAWVGIAYVIWHFIEKFW